MQCSTPQSMAVRDWLQRLIGGRGLGRDLPMRIIVRHHDRHVGNAACGSRLTRMRLVRTVTLFPRLLLVRSNCSLGSPRGLSRYAGRQYRHDSGLPPYRAGCGIARAELDRNGRSICIESSSHDSRFRRRHGQQQPCKAKDPQRAHGSTCHATRISVPCSRQRKTRGAAFTLANFPPSHWERETELAKQVYASIYYVCTWISCTSSTDPKPCSHAYAASHTWNPSHRQSCLERSGARTTTSFGGHDACGVGHGGGGDWQQIMGNEKKNPLL